MDSTPGVWRLCVGASRGQDGSHRGNAQPRRPLRGDGATYRVVCHAARQSGKGPCVVLNRGGRRCSRRYLTGSCCADVVMHDTPADEAAGVAMDVDNVGVAATVPEACERCRNGHQCAGLDRGNLGTEGTTPGLEGTAACCRRSLHSPYGEHGICGQLPWQSSGK